MSEKNEIQVCEEEESYYPEDELFAPSSHSEILQAIIRDGYAGAIEVPDLEELIDHVLLYNGSIISRMAEIDMHATCPDCSDRNKCWGYGTVIPPIGPDFYPDPSKGADTASFDQCQCDAEDGASSYIDYHYGLFNLEALIIETVAELGYGMQFSSYYLEYFYEDPPLHFLSSNTMLFNDAQIMLLPGMRKQWKPRADFIDCPLLLTG